jgi:uncharacterized protein
VGQRIPMVDYLELGDPPRLVANACEACGALYFDRRNACAKCGGTAFGRKPLGTTGRVRTFTIVKRAAPGVPTPYISAVVDLDGGGVVKANLRDVDPDPDQVPRDLAVRLDTFTAATDDDGTEAIAFGFVPA